MKTLLLLSFLFVLFTAARGAPPTALNQRVQTNGTVNVRSSPAGSVAGSQSGGRQGTVIDGPETASLSGTSYTWWKINFDSGTDGWVASIGVDLVSSGTVDVQPLNVSRSPGNVEPGGSLSVSWQIRNNGTTTASSSNSQVRITTSNSSSGNSGNNAGSSVATGSISAGATINQSKTVTVPTTPGTYYAWVIADNNDLLSQSNTSNDFAVSSSFTVTAPATVDVQPLNVTRSLSSVAPGASLSVSWQIRNNGTVAASTSNSQVRITSSGTSYGSSADNAGSSVATGSINAGSTINQSKTVTAPTAPGTYYVWVVADNNSVLSQTNSSNDFAVSSSFFVVLPPGPAPSISSVSPVSLVASNTDQTLTINGSNFVSGATLTFDPPTGADIPSSAAKLTFVSSSKITYQINNGNDYGTWTVRVNNPDGQPSGTNSFSVVLGPAPSISSVSPSTMPGLNGNQTLTINGANFAAGASLVFDPPTGSDIPSSPAKLIFVSSTKITYEVNNQGDAGPWTVKVINPDGQFSQAKVFTVQAPLAAPILSTITNPVTGSNSSQTLTLKGGNFVNKPSIILTWTGKPSYTVPSAQVTFVNAEELRMSIKTTEQTDTWTAQVQNPDGQLSEVRSFQVVAPGALPGAFVLAYDAPVWDATTSPAGPSVRLNWTTSDKATAYEVVRDGVTIATPGTALTHLDRNGLKAGSSYKYEIRALNSHGERKSAAVTLAMPGPQLMRANLVVQQVTCEQTEIQAGAAITVHVTVANLGTARAKASLARVRLSNDRVLTSSDYAVEPRDVAVGELEPGAVQTVPLPAVVPTSVPAGSYYVGAFADAGFDVDQPVEDDAGLSAAVLKVRAASTAPQLVLNTLAAGPQSIAAGGRTLVDLQLVNDGTAASEPASAVIYLSSDNLITAQDTVLEKLQANALPGVAPGRTAGLQAAVAFNLPASVKAGNYFIGAKASVSARQGTLVALQVSGDTPSVDPKVERMEPPTPMATGKKEAVRFWGSGFTSDMRITLRDKSRGGEFDKKALGEIASDHFDLMINFDVHDAQWEVQTSADGRPATTFSFHVKGLAVTDDVLDIRDRGARTEDDYYEGPNDGTFGAPAVHLGADYPAPLGSKVVSPVSGRVSKVMAQAGYGQLIVLEVAVAKTAQLTCEDGAKRTDLDGVLEVFFGHLIPTVKVGAQVIAGQTILGSIASEKDNGGHAGLHLHVGIKLKKGQMLNSQSPLKGDKLGQKVTAEYPGFWRRDAPTLQDCLRLDAVQAALVDPEQVNWNDLSIVAEQSRQTVSAETLTASDIAEEIYALSLEYKVPAVILMALVEQESDWLQFKDGGVNTGFDPGGSEGYGLTQVTIFPNDLGKRFVSISLGHVKEGQKQGVAPFENSYSLKVESELVDVDKLKADWRYNLEIGTRILLAKRHAAWGASLNPAAVDDASILENWYYPLAYYNGADANNPALSFSRHTGSNSKAFGRGVAFPYQERVFNIVAGLYPIPSERKSFFGPAIKVILPGPKDVASGSGQYEYVDEGFTFDTWDWCKFNPDGTVVTGPSKGLKTTVSGIFGHRVNFGAPSAPLASIRGVVQDLSGNAVVNVPLTLSQEHSSLTGASAFSSRKLTVELPRTTVRHSREGTTNSHGEFRFGEVIQGSSYVISQLETPSEMPPILVSTGPLQSDNTFPVTLDTSGLRPVFLEQPASTAVDDRESLQLSCVVCGSAPLAYQWFKDGTPLNGGTEAVLKINAGQDFRAGAYWVVASNSHGTARSAHAYVKGAVPSAGKIIPHSLSVVVSEGAGEAIVKVSRTGSLDVRLLCSFRSRAGTAKAWSDFEPLEGNVVFEPGRSESVLRLPVVDDDSLEKLETAYLDLVMPGSKQTVTISIEDDETNPFLDWRGQFIGAVDAAAGQAGVAAITVTGNGSFTGNYQTGGINHVLKGTLDTNGHALVTLGKTGLLLRVQLDATSNHAQIGVALLEGAGSVLAEGSSQRIGNASYFAALAQGSYTLRLARQAAPELPAGDGYAYAKVDAKGRVTATFKLPDGTSATQSASILPSGAWAVLLNPYAGSGGVYGQLRFLDASESDDLDGTLHWVKPARPKDKLFPAGFDAHVSVIGSRYMTVRAGQPWLPRFSAPPGNAQVSFFYPLSSGLPSTTITSWMPGKGISAPGVLSFTVNGSLGLITGTITTPARQPLSSAGIMLQKQGYAAGQFTLGTQTGAFEIRDVLNPVEHMIAVAADPVIGGSVSGGGSYLAGQTVTVLATPAAGYEWIRWKENGQTVATSPQLQFMANASRSLLAEFAPVVPVSFADDFNRPNAAEVGNGWLDSTVKVGQGWTGEGDINGTLRIVNQRAENAQTSGTAAIYRPFVHSSGLRVSATFNHINGGGGLQRRFLHCLGIRSNGQIGDGLAVMFYRADQNYNNSTVFLYDGATLVAQQTTSFQFSEWIRAEVDFRVDGSVQVHVANVDGVPGDQTLNFPARGVNANGSNVIFVINGSSPLKGWVDDIQIEQTQ